jgi:hypothetical protein
MFSLDFLPDTRRTLFFITSACFTHNSRSQILRFLVYKKEEVHFWPSNYSQSLVLAIEPENQKSLAIQLLKPFISDHRVVLASGFDDVAATWRWGPHVKLPPLSLSSLLSSLSADCSPSRRRGRSFDGGRTRGLWARLLPAGRAPWTSLLPQGAPSFATSCRRR